MNMFLYALIHLAFFFCLGAFFGYNLHKKKVKFELENNHEERETYCHGFEDGIYYAIGEYQPDLFRIEVADVSYREYKAIKHGPQKH